MYVLLNSFHIRTGAIPLIAESTSFRTSCSNLVRCKGSSSSPPTVLLANSTRVASVKVGLTLSLEEKNKQQIVCCSPPF